MVLLHLLYVLVFSALAFMAIANLIRNMINLGQESQRSTQGWSANPRPSASQNSAQRSAQRSAQSVPHPELLDSDGQVVNEPLLVMRSMPLEEVRSRLDQIYNDSPGGAPQSERAED
jgi:hypothetical protein